jgi:C_GCAxxG_C_C family probable redox protein
MSTKTDKAIESFNKGFNCAQSVFLAYSGSLGITRKDALRISCGLGAGMGRKQEVCGALTGAILLIGCLHGSTEENDSASKDRTYQLVRELMDRFSQKYETCLCRELLGCDMMTEEGQKMLKESSFHETKCARYIRDVGDIIEDILPELRK